jgi:hypothetical protein
MASWQADVCSPSCSPNAPVRACPRGSMLSTKDPRRAWIGAHGVQEVERSNRSAPTSLLSTNGSSWSHPGGPCSWGLSPGPGLGGGPRDQAMTGPACDGSAAVTFTIILNGYSTGSPPSSPAFRVRTPCSPKTRAMATIIPNPVATSIWTGRATGRRDHAVDHRLIRRRGSCGLASAHHATTGPGRTPQR